MAVTDERGVGYWFRYAVAAIALTRVVPARLGWWVLNRRMFQAKHSGRSGK